jgi:NAD(P)-dependent dehydrogenase (short-subunit alcohol dehydrogenase family)
VTRLGGQVAIVTGAGSGIGHAVSELFAREGARVAVVDQDAAAVQRVADAIVTAGGTAQAFVADVADEAAATRTVAAVLAAWERIDALVTCAAVSVGGDAMATSLDAWERVFAVNVRGTFLWVRAVLPSMTARRRGSIVTVGSQLAVAGGRGNVSYTASKGAVIAFTRTVALDHAPDGVRANVLVPGAIQTPVLERALARQPDPEQARERSRSRHPLGRFGTPEEVARAALYLASDDSAFTTGTLLVVDGGWLAG